MEQKVCANLECGHDRCPVKCKFLLAPRTWLFVYDGCTLVFVFADSFLFLGRPSSSSASRSWDFQMIENEKMKMKMVRWLVGFDDSMIR